MLTLLASRLRVEEARGAPLLQWNGLPVPLMAVSIFHSNKATPPTVQSNNLIRDKSSDWCGRNQSSAWRQMLSSTPECERERVWLADVWLCVVLLAAGGGRRGAGGGEKTTAAYLSRRSSAYQPLTCAFDGKINRRPSAHRQYNKWPIQTTPLHRPRSQRQDLEACMCVYGWGMWGGAERWQGDRKWEKKRKSSAFLKGGARKEKVCASRVCVGQEGGRGVFRRRGLLQRWLVWYPGDKKKKNCWTFFRSH